MAAAASAQPFDPANNFAWTENTGWTNWTAAPAPDTAEVRAGFLAGFVWGENIGWINLGNGSPSDGLSYANTDGDTFGVNIDLDTLDLFGFAWSENAGWINFDTREALADSGQQARLDIDHVRLRGFAWGENIGWLNLDDEEAFVGLAETPNLPCNAADVAPPFGLLDGADVNAYITWVGASDPRADLNGDGVIDGADVNRFITDFGSGCP